MNRARLRLLHRLRLSRTARPHLVALTLLALGAGDLACGQVDDTTVTLHIQVAANDTAPSHDATGRDVTLDTAELHFSEVEVTYCDGPTAAHRPRIIPLAHAGHGDEDDPRYASAPQWFDALSDTPRTLATLQLPVGEVCSVRFALLSDDEDDAPGTFQFSVIANDSGAPIHWGSAIGIEATFDERFDLESETTLTVATEFDGLLDDVALDATDPLLILAQNIRAGLNAEVFTEPRAD